MFDLTDKPLIKIDRKTLQKVFPDNESLRKFEELLRTLNNLVPEDLNNLYKALEEESNYSKNIDSKLNSTISLIKNIINTSNELTNNIDTVSNRQNAILNIIQILKNTSNYLEKKTNIVRDRKPKIEYIDFDLNPNLAQKQGRISWNNNDITLNLFLNDFVTLQIGQETLFLVKNTTGSTISDGKLCSFDGVIGVSGKLKAKLGIGTDNPNHLMGISTQTILNNDFGFVTNFGLVRGFNTTGSLYSETWADGDLLYPHPTIAGGLTKTQPSAPSFKSPIASVINASNSGSGSIFVRMKTGEQISTLHDVQLSSLTNGDMLRYNSTALRWENFKGANGSFTSANGKTITVLNGIITSIV